MIVLFLAVVISTILGMIKDGAYGLQDRIAVMTFVLCTVIASIFNVFIEAKKKRLEESQSQDDIRATIHVIRE